jgi:AcrR family transcriptional regulator
MTVGESPRDLLLNKVVAFAAAEGVAGRSLREIATGTGTSHRMLLYHFGSHEGLLAAVVGVVEAQQRAAMAAMTATARTPRDLMLELWHQVSSTDRRPSVRLFFSVFGLAVQGVPGTESLLAGLTGPWLAEGAAAAERLGLQLDPTQLRLAVAVARGLLLDLVAGTDAADVHASYQLFVEMLDS